MITDEEVLEAVRRGYSSLSNADDDTIIDYFADVDSDAVGGHLSNIKGILFEQEYARELAEDGVDAELFEAVNHPVSDLAVVDDGEIIQELQLKATESTSYIEETLETMPDGVEVVTTSEVADSFGEDVIDSGISETLLDEAVTDLLFPVTPFAIIRWCFGIF